MRGVVVCRRVVVVFSFIIFSLSVFAQEFKSEAELKKKAQELFEQGDYVAANPLFSQLLSLYPKDPNYNFKFGVCQLFTSENKEKPIANLEFAAKNPATEKEVYFFLGRAYHLNYRFTDAIKAYENYKKNGNPKNLKKFEVDQQILMCRNGENLLKNVKDLYVLEKKSMREEDFFRAYNTESLKGKLIVKPEEFKTSVDKKKKESSVIFISPGSEELFISSYGNDEKNGKDIFRCKKLPNGEWGPPQNLGATINTPFDEDFPFMHADGKTLYFSSKGHNSMGGYDVFKSVYDSASGSWSVPVNMDFAVSTPDDDIFFMPDSGKTYAYFASKRNSSAGRVDVYKLKVDIAPVELAIIKGKIISEVGGGSPEATITVKKGDEVIGVFKSNPSNGVYFLSVPNGGRLTFEVESDDFSRRSETVIIPTQYELKALNQLITLKPEKLVITNKFDEVVADEDPKAVALAYLKEKAKLEVNFSDVKPETKTSSEEIASSGREVNEASQDNTKVVTPEVKTPAKFSNQELVDIAKEDAAEARKEAEDLQDKSDNANFAARKKEEEAREKLSTAAEMESSANSISDPVKKEEELQKAALIRKEADLLNKEAASINVLAQSLYKESQEKFREAKDNEKYAQDLEKAVKSNSRESILKLTEQRAQLEASSENEKENDFGLQQIKLDAAEKKEASDKAEKVLETLRNELSEAEAEQKALKDQADKTKNKKEKQALIQQADLLTPDIEEKRRQVDAQAVKADQLAVEAEALNNQLEIFSKVLGGSSLAEITSSVEPQKTASSTTTEGALTSSEKQSPVVAVDLKHNDRLTQITSKPEGAEKQKELASVYDAWATDLQAEAQKRKTDLKKISDPQKKSETADAIMALEAAAAEKLALASDARAKADELSSVTVSNTNNSAPADQAASVSSEPTAINETSAKTDSINSDFSAQLASALNLGSESQKDEAKLKVLDNWAKALESQAADIRSKIAVTTDAEEKKKLEEQLTSVEQQLSEKQTQASLAFSKAERTKKQNAEIDRIISTPAGKSSQYSVRYSSEITATDTIKDPGSRESAKAAIYAKWVADIRTEKAEIESYLAKTNDENSKKALNEKLSALDSFLGEQTTLAEASRKASEDASRNEIQQTSGPLAGNESNSGSNSTASDVQELNNNYSDQLASADTIKDPSAKNEAKVKLLNEWSEKLTSTASDVRTKAAAIGDDEIRSIELSKADQLENEAKSKQQQAIALTNALASNVTHTSGTTPASGDPDPANVLRTAGSNTGSNDTGSENAVKSSNETDPLAASGQKDPESTVGSSNGSSAVNAELPDRPAPVNTDYYNQELAALDTKSQGDELVKAEEKRKLYDSWSRDIEKQIAYLRKEQETSSDPGRKSEIDEKIKELERESLEKQAQASLHVAKADRLRKIREQEELAASSEQNKNTSVENPAVSDSGNAQVENTADTNKAEVSKSAVTSNNETRTNSASYTAALKASEKLKAQSDSLKLAMTFEPDQAKRAEMLSKATQFENESYRRRAEASVISGNESKAEFTKNALLITDYAGVSARNQSDEVTMANMLATESAYYRKEASTIRSTVNVQNVNASSLTSLERAEEYEKLAVEKQKKAIELYAKANQGYTPASNSLAVNAASNEAPSSSSHRGSATSDAPEVKSTVGDTSDLQTNKAALRSDTLNETASDETSSNETASNKTTSNKTTSNETVTDDTTSGKTSTTGNAAVSAKRYATKNDSLNATRINSEAGRLESLALAEEKNANTYRSSAVREQAVADSLLAESIKPDRSAGKATLQKEAEQHKALVKLYNNRADSVASLAANSRAAADAKRKEAELLANAEPVKTRTSETDQRAGTNTDLSAQKSGASDNAQPQVKDPVVKNSDVTVPDDYLTETNELKREIFIAFANKAAYSATKPIPINEKIPNGIIFKVQVGAFRNAISPEVFKGFAPLMGETSPNGITRYTAGFFKLFDNANNARKEINGMGYPDAFVVAFCNGKRISVSEAQRLVKEGKDCSGSVLAGIQDQPVKLKQPTESGSENSTPVNGSLAENKEVNNPQSSVNTRQAPDNIPAENVAVEKVKGLFYTVQVGVFSAKVPASKLNFLQPLYSEPVNNGLVRYSVGMYDNLEIAKKAKQIIVEFGVNDAFVTAYVNGKRITVAEAAKLESENGKSVFASDLNMNRMPEAGYNALPAERGTTVPQNEPRPVIVRNDAGLSDPPVTVTPAIYKERTPVIPMSDTGLVFRVQIGAFKDEVPIDVAAKFIRIADRGINHYMADSLTIYTVGGTRDYRSAEDLKQAVVAEGIADAFVVAYRKGEKIPVEEAIKNQ